MKMVGHTSGFLFGIYWWTWKTITKWPNKKHKNFDNLMFLFKKLKENTWIYHYFTPVYQKSWYWVILCPFIPLKTWKIRILKKLKKNYWRYHFIHVCQKSQSHDVKFLRYNVKWTFFCLLGNFLLSYPLNPGF